MATYLDTSAVAKLYHEEPGSANVEDLLTRIDVAFVSRLGVLEMHSVLSGKVRTKELTQAASELARRRFRSEVRKRRFRVVAVRVRHYEDAEDLVAAYGSSHGLRTLDSLQLAVAGFATQQSDRFIGNRGQGSPRCWACGRAGGNQSSHTVGVDDSVALGSFQAQNGSTGFNREAVTGRNRSI